MQLPDGQRVVDIGTCTLPFTGVVTNPAADSGERMLLFEEL
jgi:glycerol uptake facilitator-like aquaporin